MIAVILVIRKGIIIKVGDWLETKKNNGKQHNLITLFCLILYCILIVLNLNHSTFFPHKNKKKIYHQIPIWNQFIIGGK